MQLSFRYHVVVSSGGSCFQLCHHLSTELLPLETVFVVENCLWEGYLIELSVKTIKSKVPPWYWHAVMHVFKTCFDPNYFYLASTSHFRQQRQTRTVPRYFSFWVTTRDRLARISRELAHIFLFLVVVTITFFPQLFVISWILRRAAKCYQKSLDLQPSNVETAMCLGDVLTASGNEVISCHMTCSMFMRICCHVMWLNMHFWSFIVLLLQDEAYEVYSKVVLDAPLSKWAWNLIWVCILICSLALRPPFSCGKWAWYTLSA